MIIVFFEIAYNNSFQQCVTSSRGKTHENNVFLGGGGGGGGGGGRGGGQIWAKTGQNPTQN